MRRASLLAALVVAACHPAPLRSPLAAALDLRVAPAGEADRDGAILAVRPILVTPRSEYYAITYRSSGFRVNGFLGRPRGRSGPAPAVIWNRGGNREFGLLDPRALVPYVEAGYVAVGSQYRGNGGSEGQEEFGGADVKDVLNLVPLLRSLPDVDPSRIGMVGYSRGGMMTYLALREDASGQRAIRVAATVGGVAEQGNLDERPDMLPVYLALIGCEPSECPQAYAARSALEWAGEMETPLLLLHGEADDRVPVRQAQQLAQRLREAERNVKLITFPGEDHGLSGHHGGLPEILSWLGEHLGMAPETYAPATLIPAIQEVIQRWPSLPTG